MLPGPRDIFVDLDSEAALQFLYTRLATCAARADLACELLAVRPSRTEGHYHAYLRAPHNLTDVERIAIQAVLGSDLVREHLSLQRVWAKTDRPPTTLFESTDWVDPRGTR